MRKSRFNEEQIIGILKESEAGVPTTELCRKHGIAAQTLYRWKGKYGGMEVSEARRLRALEEENRQLKHTVAELLLDKRALQAVVSPEETPRVVVLVAIGVAPALQGQIPAIHITRASTLNEAAGLEGRDAAWLGCINKCPLAEAESSEGGTISRDMTSSTMRSTVSVLLGSVKDRRVVGGNARKNALQNGGIGVIRRLSIQSRVKLTSAQSTHGRVPA